MKWNFSSFEFDLKPILFCLRSFFSVRHKFECFFLHLLIIYNSTYYSRLCFYQSVTVGTRNETVRSKRSAWLGSQVNYNSVQFCIFYCVFSNTITFCLTFNFLNSFPSFLIDYIVKVKTNCDVGDHAIFFSLSQSVQYLPE